MPGLEHAVLHDRFFGVAGHVDHLQRRPSLDQLPVNSGPLAPGITTSVSSTSIDGFCSNSRSASSAFAATSTV